MRGYRNEYTREQTGADRSRKTRKKRSSHRRRTLAVVCYMAIVLGCCIFLYNSLDVSYGSEENRTGLNNLSSVDMDFQGTPGQGGEEASSMGDGSQDAIPPDLMSGSIKLDKLHSPYVILMDAATGQIIAEKNSGARMYPASMTKLMAALVAVEHTEDQAVDVEIPQSIFAGLYLEHASLAGFEPGEKVSPEELLYGMLLPSGAECCSTYALWLAGSEEDFVGWMNDKAEALGMENTHFVNTTGLHDEGHYSSARDMAILLRECLKNDTLRRVLSAESFQTAPTAQHPQGLTLESTLFQAITQDRELLRQKSEGERAGATLLGGKTGYTSQAGLCLASFALINGREYLLVTAGAEGNHYTEAFHVQDALEVYAQIAAVTKE